MANKIGRYEILDEIGRGAFGQVYRAFDPDVNRRVAIKVLNTVGDPDILARFRNEAFAAGNLNHRNIVTIYDFGEHNGVPYIVMELVDGQDLQKTMAARKLTLLQKIEIMTQVAEGLHFAHVKGVIHRDVKPANIMVLPDGLVKILDFGIARLNQANAARQTRTGFLVGTILYMSPEQFQDAIVDSLCDIWAYGVVYYEMLTGKHPFEAQDNAALMYRVTRMDPARIRAIAPDCPEALEQIVHRALARDRELRYQTLDDLQLDMRPVLDDLRGQQAGGMISEARSRFEAGQLDEAQALVRRMLELDPRNAEARQLRDQISRQMQRRSVRPRVESLLKDAQREIAERRFSEATESLESALRLDSSDSSVRLRLDECRRLAQLTAQAAELLTQAEREFRLQEFGSAYRLCSEALRLDEEHPQGKRLMDAIQEEMARREHKRKLEEGLEKARGLMLIQAFEEVFPILEALRAEFPSEPQVEQLLASAQARQQDRDRRNRLQEELQAAKRLLKEQRFADAVERLRRMRLEFPGETQVAELLAFAEEELRRQTTEQEIAALVERAAQGSAQNQFDAALKIIDQGLQKYPNDSALIRLFQSTMAAKKAFEKQRAIEDALRRTGELRAQGQPGEALDVIEAAVNRHGPEPELLRIRRQLQTERDQLRRAEEIAAALRKGEELLRQKNFAQAVAALQNAAAKYPDEPALQALLARVSEAHREDERRRFIQEQLARAAQLEGAQNWDAALALLEDALARYPDSTELGEARARLQKSYQSAQQAAAGRLQIKQALAARDWDLAARLIEEARSCVDSKELAEFQQHVEAGRNRAGLDALVTQVQEAAGNGDLDRAQELLDAGLAQYGKQDRLLRLRQFVQREAEFRANLVSAKRALAENRFDAADDFLQKALRAKPADAEALGLADRIAAGRDTAHRAEQAADTREQLARAANLENAGKWEAALAVIEDALARDPASTELAVARARIQKILQLTEQRESGYRENMAAARKALEERRFDEAGQLARKALQAKPEDKFALALLERIDVERKLQKRASKPPLGDTAREVETIDKTSRIDDATSLLDLHALGGTAKPASPPAPVRTSPPLAPPPAAPPQAPPRTAPPQSPPPAPLRTSPPLAPPHAGPPQSPPPAPAPPLLPRPKPKSPLTLALWIVLGVAGVSAPIWLVHKYLGGTHPQTDGSKTGPGTTAPLAVLETWTRRTALRGEPYAAVVETSGGAAPISWSIPRGALPAGLKLDAASGRIEGTPTAEGSYTFVAKASDRNGRSAEREFAIAIRAPEVVPPGAPLAVSAALEPSMAQRGRSYSAVLRATGGSPPVLWSLSRGALPRGLAIDPRTGQIEGTPLAEGQYNFTVKATDRARHTAQQPFSIMIVRPIEDRPPATPPPVISAGDPPPATRGERYNPPALRASGGSGSLSWSVSQGSLPRGVTLDAAGRLDGTPTEEGTVRFTAKVTDREGRFAERAFSMVVQAPKKAPPPACVAKPFVLSEYGDSPAGRLTWTGSLATGEEVRITKRRATSGSVRGEGLPDSGIPVRIGVLPATVRKKAEPSQANCWISDLVLQNDGPPLTGITINWVVFQN